jgi:hypothetical protein
MEVLNPPAGDKPPAISAELLELTQERTQRYLRQRSALLSAFLKKKFYLKNNAKKH